MYHGRLLMVMGQEMLFLYMLAATVAAGALATRMAPERVTALGLRAERRFAGLSTRSEKVGRFEMPYLEGGDEDDEVLVLLHGFAGDKDNFTRAARFLTPHYRVIIPDLPGFGDATREFDANYYMSDQVRRLHIFLGQLGIDRVHLGGNSMGGFIAAQYAATYPGAVRSLWLIDPGGTAASHDSPMLQEYERSGINPLLVCTVGAFDTTIAAATHKRPFLPRFARTTLARRAVADFALHTHIMEQLQDSPLLEASYAPMATPALIVWGEEDAVLSPAGADSFSSLFPNSQVRRMPGIGHMPMLEAPRKSAEDYLAFRRGFALEVAAKKV